MTDFPMDAVIFNKISEVFKQTRGYVLLLFPLAFFIRISFGFILLKGSDFADILKDSLFLFLGLFFFMDILKLTLQIPYFVASDLSFGEWSHINLGEGFFAKALQRIVEWIGIISYWISFGLYAVIISVLGFLAGYILFFGTMFRAYGMLKVFFILLLTASLWPLLWHSINFAVFTIAVSDNAFANNVIVGGASLAKVILPLWIISKSSKIPIAQGLKKLTITGGGLAGAGALGAYSALRGGEESAFQGREAEEEARGAEAAEIHISQRAEEQAFATGGFPHSEKAWEEEEPEDFSLTAGEPGNGEFQTVSLPEERDSFQSMTRETKEETGPSGNSAAQEKSLFQESASQNQTVRETQVQSESGNQGTEGFQSHSQTVYEAGDSVSEAKDSVSGADQVPNQVSGQNQGMTLSARDSMGLSQNEGAAISEKSAAPSLSKKKEEVLFDESRLNESVQGLDFIEEEESASFLQTNTEKEGDL